MDEQIFEGTWEEVAAHAEDFAGKQVRLTVLDEAPPTWLVARREKLRHIAQLRQGMPMTDGSDTQRLLREARAGAMYGYEPTE
jgi:hypothetical protein